MNVRSERVVRAEVETPAWLKLDDALFELLRTVQLFEGLSRETLDELAKGCRLLELTPGTRLIEEGALGDEFYVVIDGALEARQRDASGAESVLRQLKRGASLGEVALLEQTKRTASVVAVAPSKVISLSRAAFDSVLAGHDDLRTQLLALVRARREFDRRRRERPSSEQLLQRLATLTGIEDLATLRDLERELSWETLPAGAALFRQGDPGDALFFVVDGALDVFVRRGDGTRMRLDRLESGAVVGEMALLTQAPRSADVLAHTDVSLLRLAKDGYLELVAAHPSATVVLSRALASRLASQLEARTMRTQLGAMSIPTDAEIADIVATPDLVLRNLRITQMYFQLSLQLAGLLGQQDANWCTFATHASKTAGYSIRREELPGYALLVWLDENTRLSGLEKRLNQLADAVVSRSDVAAHFDGIVEHISNCISAGNLKVFAELAPVFSLFLREHHEKPEKSDESLRAVLERLAPGDVSIGGQRLLEQALTQYHEAIYDPDPKRKAERILLGNCLIGLHEQTRLQPYIVEALDTPVGDLFDGVERVLGLFTPSVVKKLLRRGREGVAPTATRRFREVATKLLMSLRLPYGDVSLGRDLPRLPQRRVFPDVLESLTLPALRETVERFDRSAGNLRNSRSRDWGDLDDRMNTIVNLFRSRQRSYELFGQPFHFEQRKVMQTGSVPRGRL